MKQEDVCVCVCDVEECSVIVRVQFDFVAGLLLILCLP